jgi:hypothetical protein
MQQLKASIARDLVQGQNENSATRELLKQYVPLNGIISSPEGDTSLPQSVENCLAPHASLAPHATVARGATHKYDDDDIKIKNKSSSKGKEPEIAGDPVENHTCAAAPPEKETAEQDFLFVREAYEKATGNRWNQSDSDAYNQNNIGSVPAARIVSILETVARRTPTKINSFKYFVKEITAQPDPRNRIWQKKRLEQIVNKIRDISVGRANYSMADFVEDVKCSCAREGIVFENDLFNELVS